jgi:hypothetical protein
MRARPDASLTLLRVEPTSVEGDAARIDAIHLGVLRHYGAIQSAQLEEFLARLAGLQLVRFHTSAFRSHGTLEIRSSVSACAISLP